MNKVLQLGLIVLATLGLAFTACEQPLDNNFTTTDTITTVGLNELPAPDGVTATAYGPTGVIRVAWNPVANASSYHLYRRSEDSKGATVKYISKAFTGISSASDLYYDDIISFTNEFESGASYTYRVVASSDYASTAVNQSSWSTSNADWFFIQNSSAASNTVKFSDLLPQGSKLAMPANVKLTQADRYNDSGSYGKTPVMQVSWSVEPAVNYIVSYGRAGEDNDTSPRTLTYYVTSGTEIGDNQKTYALDIPAIFGEFLVEVVARSAVSGLSTNDISGTPATASYYLDSEPAVVTHAFARTTLDTPRNFVVTESSNNQVTLSWEKMADAESYKVYRYKYNTATSQIYEGWKDITDEIAYSLDSGDWRFYGHTATELTAAAGTRYTYMIISVNGDAVSLPAVATTTNVYTSPVLTASFDTSTYWDIQAKDWRPIRISWNTKSIEKENYKLYRVVMKNSGLVRGWLGNFAAHPAGPGMGQAYWNTADNVSYLWDGGAWVILEDQAAAGSAFDYQLMVLSGIEQDLIDGLRYSLSDKAAYRNIYRYKLETYDGNGVLKGTSYSETISAYPYSFGLDIALQADNNTNDAYGIKYRLTTNDVDQLKKAMKATEKVRISRAPANKQGERTGAYVQIKQLYRDDFNSSSTSWTEEYKGTGKFIYKAEVLDGDAVSATFFGSGKDIATVTASDPAGLLYGNANLITKNGQIALRFPNLSSGTGITKTRLIIRYAETDGPAVPESGYTEKELFIDVKQADNPNAPPALQTYTYETSGTIPTAAGTTWAIDVYVIPGDFETGTLNTITPQSFNSWTY